MPHIGHFFSTLPSVDSTNNYAMAQVHAGLARHGFVYSTLQQTAGKGQRGKTWSTDSGSNITLSVVLEPSGLNYAKQFFLSAAVALACLDFTRIYAGEKTKIKWPNDIYWSDRKAGGILIENVLKGEEWKHSIVGIGININQTLFPPGIRN